MILRDKNTFVLSTDHTSYIFEISETGQAEHLYYGEQLPAFAETQAIREQLAWPIGNAIAYDREHPAYNPEILSFEFSTYGTGDTRQPMFFARDAKGREIFDFCFEKAEIRTKQPLETMPSSYAGEGVEELVLTLKARHHQVYADLHYTTFDACDVIVKSVVIRNEEPEPIHLERALSNQLDLPKTGYLVHNFSGSWTREMHKNETKVSAGCFSLESHVGTSSNRVNPFFMVSDEHTTEDAGECFGFHLLYSGNHRESAEVNAYSKTRIQSGISPIGFGWELLSGDIFETPEAALCYSASGFGNLSRNFHHFINEHIVRGEWKKKERPVLLNSWEACYFDINEKKLLSMAKAAKSVGIELFVMDDGWFAARDNDTCSLGDWVVNKKKLPNGLQALVEKIRAEGLSFGIWVEPEMVNEDSDLFRAHPDWVLGTLGSEQSVGRNQMILDLTRTEVQDYILDCLRKILSCAEISYVKWDMNRIFSDVSSHAPAYQAEASHRYVIGLYRILDTITKEFPQVLFEGCASGGNRFDAGMLCYFPQIWASDDTDAYERTKIQQGYSYGYPLSVMGCHVSGIPNHQTLRHTPLSSRFHVASYGVLGYELNLADASKEELEEIREQIGIYKENRALFQFGDFYRLPSAFASEEQKGTFWMVVDPTKNRGIGMIFQDLLMPNQPMMRFFARGLESDRIYRFYNVEKKINIKDFGDLINTVSPIHIRQDSLLHTAVSKVYKMEGETEDYRVPGAVLMHAGIALKQSYGGTGFDRNVRFFPDFGSRMYFIASEGEK